jgi:polyisoprenoid-binding protein YceI
MRYRVQRGLVEVKARSSIHDTDTRFARLEGWIEFDPDNTPATRAEISVDMRVFDAGDKLKNWKLKSDLEPDKHPTAAFTLARLEDAHEPSAGRFEARARGQLRWRGRSVDLRLKGQASVDRRSIDARATFELDVRDLGVKPPGFLMFKVENVVTVQVSIFAIAGDSPGLGQ